MPLDKKYIPIVTSLVLGAMMGLIMSLVITVINTGISGDFLMRWMKSFLVAVSIGVPLATVLVPWVNKLIHKWTKTT
jgi:hypothetical protein